MSVVEPQPTAPPRPRPTRRPLLKQFFHLLRRAHLYLGLFLLPWAILYGVTAFLFNHPTAFSDNPSVSFGKEGTAGTPLESVPSPQEQAEQVVAKLNELHRPEVPYALGAGEVKYAREFAFVTAKADGRTINVLVDVRNGGGTVRSTPDKPTAEPVKAPFAVGSAGPGGGRGGRGGGPPRGEGERPTRAEGIKLEHPLPERVKAAVPVILDRTGFAGESVTVTSVPDLVFPIEADGKTWTATYNATTGSVSGTLPEATAGPNWRQFLLRLHTAHGYPGEPNARWGWAVIVDVMAAVMVFWGLSGLVMWWQIKATRWAGAVVLVLSAVAATALGLAMHAAMTP
jgi:hypothetical protein